MDQMEKNKNTTLSTQFQNAISKNRRKGQERLPITNICMTAHFHGLVQAFQIK